MNRVEATIFAASEPVTRETLARIVGKTCSIDPLIDDIREELRGRPYDLVAVAGGWKHLTRPVYADAIRAALGTNEQAQKSLTQSEVLVLMCIAYFQPITRAELSSFFGKEISRDFIGNFAPSGSSLLARARRSRARLIPTSRRKRSCWNSGSTHCAICRTLRRSRTRACSRRRSSSREISCPPFPA